MSRFGYSDQRAEQVKDQLDRELKGVEYRLDRIRSTVPQAGATVARLDEARDIARDVVSDLHDVISDRTEVAA
jgi:hypothetical protein